MLSACETISTKGYKVKFRLFPVFLTLTAPLHEQVVDVALFTKR